MSKVSCETLDPSPEYLKALRCGYDAVVPVGSIWQHVSGKKYRVVCVAVSECSIEPKVVYACMESGHIWSRPLREWLELVCYNSRPASLRYAPYVEPPPPPVAEKPRSKPSKMI